MQKRLSTTLLLIGLSPLAYAGLDLRVPSFFDGSWTAAEILPLKGPLKVAPERCAPAQVEGTPAAQLLAALTPPVKITRTPVWTYSTAPSSVLAAPQEWLLSVLTGNVPASRVPGSLKTQAAITVVEVAAPEKVSPVVQKTTTYLEELHNVPPDTAKSIATALVEGLKTARIPLPLALAVMKVESGFDPSAVSRSGAAGLMQVVPSIHLARVRTALERPALPLQDARKALLQPEVNVETGVAILSECYDRHEGNVSKTAACYNGYTTPGVGQYKAKLVKTYDEIAQTFKRWITPRR